MSASDWDILLHLDSISWATFRVNILMSVSVNHATEESAIDLCRKQQTADKQLIINIMQYEYPPSITNESHQKYIKWQCVFRPPAIEFTCILEMRSVRQTTKTVEEVVDDILATGWAPTKPAHRETIYYICGSTLTTLRKLANWRTSCGFARELRRILKSASTKTKDAQKASLPPQIF